MGNGKTTKINLLIRKWPRGTVATASYLKRQGFTYDLLTKYRRSGWIKSFGQGAYILPEDRVEWPGALYAVQSQLGLEVHAGGKTALELKGYGHYVPEETRTLFLYAQPRVILPAWFSGERVGLRLVVTRTSLFPQNSPVGFSEWKEREFSIRISSPERAAMEMLYLVPEKVSFEESLLIMESLVTLR
ncbi:MAG: AbiEi antitoxin N-terminal domain-containing protein, partial [Deltaproteobacteria bacterium]|nr:AbiEi antitoxin N-terminal domain-containing protein [Deltaproteobacteria bacterium]